jgi:cbb3-type cytochrome oxidase cytochrome c subunit
MMNNGAALFLGILLSVAASFWTLLFAPQLQIGRQQVRALEGGELYPAPRPGLAQRGAVVYRSLGCAECHTTQVRQTGAIFDVLVAEVGTNLNAVAALFGETAMGYGDEGLDARHFRKLPAIVGTNLTPRAAQKLVTQFTAVGAKGVPVLIPLGPDVQRGWGVRLSVAQDYLHDYPVLLGNLRLGPDLANFGARQTNLADIHIQLYGSPRVTMGSLMPPYRFLYERRPLTNGAALPSDAILLTAADGNSPAQAIIPSEDAVALVAYLMSLKADALLFEAPRPKPATSAPPSTNAPTATNATAAAAVQEPEGRARRSARAGMQPVAAARRSAAELPPSSLRRSHEAPLQALRRARSDAPYHPFLVQGFNASPK